MVLKRRDSISSFSPRSIIYQWKKRTSKKDTGAAISNYKEVVNLSVPRGQNINLLTARRNHQVGETAGILKDKIIKLLLEIISK